jgi:hypothetical protein
MRAPDAAMTVAVPASPNWSAALLAATHCMDPFVSRAASRGSARSACILWDRIMAASRGTIASRLSPAGSAPRRYGAHTAAADAASGRLAYAGHNAAVVVEPASKLVLCSLGPHPAR